MASCRTRIRSAPGSWLQVPGWGCAGKQLLGKMGLCVAAEKYQVKKQHAALPLPTLRSAAIPTVCVKFSTASKCLYLFLLSLH